MDNVQLFLCSGYADIGKPPFLLKLALVHNRVYAGEYTVLKARNEHNGKFKPLSRMERHKHYSIGFAVVVVNIGNKCNILKKA